MAKQTLTFTCPFCKNATITADFFPPVVKRSKGPWGGHKPDLSWSAESLIITTPKCPSCGKSDKELAKAYAKGTTKKVSHEERLRRLKEAGLPTLITNER